MGYKFHKVGLKRGGSYIESPEWLLYKRETINTKNENNDECLWWSITSALNYNKIKKKELENIFEKNINMKIKLFSYHQGDWENFEQKNESITLNILFALFANSGETALVYKSEHSFKQENSMLLLIINDNEKYSYFAAKS